MRGWLKDIRLSKGMSLEDVASRCGITRQTIWFIENGDRNPSVETAKRIAGVLDVNWTDFFEEEKNNDTGENLPPQRYASRS